MKIPNIQIVKRQFFLFIVLLFSLGSAYVYGQRAPLSLVPAAGEFSKTINVRIEHDTEEPPQYRFSGSSNENWVTYKYPLRLTALPGEERLFTIQVRYQEENGEKTNTYQYKIDKKAPLPPEIKVRTQNGQKVLNFTNNKSDSRIKYWFSSFEKNRFQIWNGETPQITSSEMVKAYCTDTAGNQSSIVTKKIYSDSPCKSPDKIMLASPVEGTFANPQWLAIPNSHCFEWIRYTTNGNSPQANGTSYKEPVLIDKTDVIQLRIQAKLYNSNKIMEKRLKYTVNEPQGPTFKALSVIEPETTVKENGKLPVPLVDEGVKLYYSLNETPVSTSHPMLTEAVQLHSAEGMKNYIPYRIGAYVQSEEEMVQYRFLYVIDNRIPPNPTIQVSKPIPFRSEIEVELIADEDASIYYTTDGSTPDRFSPRYSEILNIQSSKASKLGVIPLQAISRYPNGNTSEIVRKLLPYDREVPISPDFKIIQEDKDGATIHVSHPDPDVQIVYAIGYGETPLLQVNNNSPSLPNKFRIDFPYGYQGRAFLRFAARDKAGNISSATATARVDVDNIPPAPPTIRLVNNNITLKSDSDIYFKIEELHKEYQKYSEPIEIDVEEGRKKEFHVYAYSVDESENRSKKVGERFIIDKREAKPPQFISSVNTATHNKPFSVRCIPPYTDSLVYYKIFRLLEDETLPEQAQNVTPGFDDTQYTDAISLTGSEDKEIRYLLKARSYIPSSDRWSSVATTSFTVDRKPPTVPEFSSIIDTTLFSKPVTIKKTESNTDSHIWVYAAEHIHEHNESEVNVSEQITAEMVRTKGMLLSRGLLVEGLPDQVKEYNVYFAAFDPSGNTTVRKAAKITIDQKDPQVPPLKGVPSKFTVAGPVEIFNSKEYPEKVIYELTSNGGPPPEPTYGSPVLGDESLVLKSTEILGTTTYVFSYRGIDMAGNMSPVITNTFRVSNLKPTPPNIHIEDLENQLFLIKIDSESDSSVYAKINGNSFKPYNGEITFYQKENIDELKVEAYTENVFGIRSEITTNRLSFEKYTQKLITGIEDGGLYTEDVLIKPATDNIDIRYKLTDSDFQTQELSYTSSKLFSDLKIKVPTGRTVKYTLSVGIFDHTSNRIISSRTFQFTIDKTAPMPPDIVGIQSDYHYTQDQILRILSSDEATVYFRTLQENRSDTPFRRYVQPEKITARPGTRKDILVEAWTEDRAGNRSKTVVQNFIIDKASIYVAPDGKDAFSGGKENPFKSLDRAMYEAVTTHRNTIYLAGGEYTINNPVVLQNQLTIIGGLNKTNWKPENDSKTFISIGPKFNTSKPLFTVKQGSLKLERLVLSNMDIETALCVQEGEHSTLLIRDTEILHANGKAPTILQSRDGNLVLNNSTIEVGPVENGNIIQIDKSSAVFRNFKIASKDSYSNLTLLRLDGTDIEIIDSDFSANNAEYIQVISAEKAHIRIENSSINYGSARVNSTGIRQNGGTLIISDSYLGNRNSSAHVATGLDLVSVNTELSSNIFAGNAELGLVQIKSKDSSINLNGSNLSNSSTREFSYHLRLRGGSCALKNTKLSSDSSYDVYGLELAHNTVAMVQNSRIELSQGESGTTGVSIDGPVVCTLQESSLITSPTDVDDDDDEESNKDTVAVHQQNSERAAGDIKLVQNMFEGWDYILLSDERKATTIQELEEEIPPFDKKTPHHGNKAE